MVTPPPQRPRRRRAPLQRSLLALVLVPVIGLTTTVGLVVGKQVSTLAAADRAVEEVQAAVALDEVRNRVAQEVVPVLAGVVAADPRTVSSLGVDPASVSGTVLEQLTRQLSTAQRQSDDAVRAARTGRSAADAAAAATALAGVRAATAQDLALGYQSYSDLLTALSGDISAHLRTARSLGLRGETATALGDLQRTTRASSLATLEFPLYLGAFRGDASASSSFVVTWGGYVQAASEIAGASSPPAAEAWRSATATEASRALDAAFAATAMTQVPASLADFAGLAAQNTARNEDLRGATTVAADRAVAGSQREYAAALQRLHRLLGLLGGTVLLSLVGALLVRRSIARPLRRLAEQAAAVGQGELVDVSEDGPDEVRTVAQGLAAAVESLRRVRDQAQAVADGDLDSDVVRQPLDGPLGAVVHSSVTKMIVAIHERERLQADLVHQASHDSLTELPNRGQARVLVDRALHRAERGGHRIGLLFVDLDHFKQVNDSLGHAAGDQVLRAVAERMHTTVRGGDVVARLGGDEFVVLVEPVEDEKGLLDLGRRLITAIGTPVDVGGRSVRVGASIGVAVSSAGTTTSERLLRDADAAAYRAKAAGRGVVEVFDDALRAELAARSELEEALRTAMAQDQLVLHYQPVLDLATGRTKSVEALVRWQRPGFGLVPPDAFIPVAEASSLICDLGRWALAEATRQLVRWDAEGGGRAGLDVAVNVSGRHLATNHLLEDVTDALVASGVDPHRLTVEITETVLVDEPLAMEHLRALREIGVRVAIDDFGTGYTSIGQLSRLPVDVLKIDRSFVSSPEAGNADLVRLLISAAHSFSLGVVAEGVEEDSQLTTLLAASCDSAQGFLFARPVPAQDVPTAAFPMGGGDLSALPAAAGRG